MDWPSVGSFVSTVGFPIALSLFLIAYLGKGMKELKDSLDNNTLMLTRLVERVGRRYDADDDSL